MNTIKLGDPMPEPCKSCGSDFGYQLTDSCRRNYDTIILTGEEDAQGIWSDYVKTTKYGTRAFCANCGHDLKLKVDRS